MDWEIGCSSGTVPIGRECAIVEKKKRAMTKHTDFMAVIRHSETRFSFDY